jgi:hypothetical protein
MKALTKEMIQGVANTPKVGCYTNFDLPEDNSIVVADCQNITDFEQQTMLKGLRFKWHRDAMLVCSQNGEQCPDPELFNFSPTSQSCEPGSDGKYAWKVAATFTAKYTSLGIIKKK